MTWIPNVPYDGKKNLKSPKTTWKRREREKEREKQSDWILVIISSLQLDTIGNRRETFCVVFDNRERARVVAYWEVKWRKNNNKAPRRRK